MLSKEEMKVSNITQELARFASETKWQDLPADIIYETKRVLMDSIGCGIGSLTTEEGKMYAALGRRYGGPPESSIIGTDNKVSPSTAALVNGQLMFTLDYDSVMSNAHDADYIIPTILAIAESVGASGKDLVLAAALGFEISSRLGIAVGQHPLAATLQAPRPARPGLSGNAHSNFGAAAGASRLMKFDEETMLHAMGIAGHLCMVLDKSRWGGGERSFMHKYGVPGWQGTGAVTAVLLAEMGYTGDTTVLDDPERGFAFFTGYSQWYPEKILEDIGNTWWFMHRLHYKPYPCCGAFHSTLDCLYDIIEQNNLMPEEIESIKAYCGPSMYAANAIQEIQTNISAAEFSPPYAISLLANRVKVGPEWHDKTTARDPKIIKFMDKVTCTGGHPDSQKRLAEDPLSALSKCEVVARGETFTVERTYRRGTIGTEAAPTDDDIIGKFRHNTERILTQNKIDKAVESLVNLEKIDNISQLMSNITL